MLRDDGQGLRAACRALLYETQYGLHARRGHLLKTQQHHVVAINTPGTNGPHGVTSVRCAIGILLGATTRRFMAEVVMIMPTWMKASTTSATCRNTSRRVTGTKIPSGLFVAALCFTYGA